MKSRRRNASENLPTNISRRRRRENSEWLLPTDLLMEILSRLPANSIARCRCVSKLWNSTLGLPDFTDLFFTKSLARPHLLFSCEGEDDGKMFFFSSAQITNRNENSSSAIYHMNLPFDDNSEICGSVNGLVCLTRRWRCDTVPVILNTSTGQSLPYLPKVVTKKTNWFEVKSFFGYDPSGKQFKVLSMTLPSYELFQPQRIAEEHQVLTLGTGNLSWRMLDCWITHLPLTSGICIDGVLYYIAAVVGPSLVSMIMIVCFDVRSEKFRFIKIDKDMDFFRGSSLVNYRGKLAWLFSDGLDGFMFHRAGGIARCFYMCVLEDPEKQIWSRHVYEIPPMRCNIVEVAEFCFAGVYGTNEIVFSPRYVSDPFYVLYYNIESKTTRRVEIQGMGAYEDCRVPTKVNQIEDVKLMEMFRTYNLRPRK